jgi:predicted permease
MADTTIDLSYLDFIDFRNHCRTFDGLVAYDLRGVGFARDSHAQAEMKMGYTVSGDFFQVLGVRPEIGRFFRPEEDHVPGRDPVVVLAYDLWKQEFESDPAVLGRIVRLNGIRFTVIGVANESFTGVDQFIRPSFFIPFMMASSIDPGETVTTKRDNRTIGVKGRLKPGISLKTANEDVTTLAKSLAESHSDTNRGVGAAVRSEVRIRLDRNPVYGPLVASLFVLVVLVLLIACCNIANLMLSRGRERAREIAVRLAIGSSRLRLIRQLMAESLLIAVSGGSLGLLVAQIAVEFFSRIEVVGDVPIRLSFEIDGRVLVFTFVLSVLSAIVFGLVPALQSTRPNLSPALKAGDLDDPQKRLLGRSALVTVQVAISLVLLIGASQIYRGARATLAADRAFRIERTLTMRLDTEIAGYDDSRMLQFYKTLVEGAGAVNGVKSATLSSFLPLTNNSRVYTVVPEGFEFPAGQETVGVFASTVGDSYFESFDVPILKGRPFRPTDTEHSPLVAIVNDTFAQKYLGSEPVGRHLKLNLPGGFTVAEVVGVAATGQYLSLVESPTGFLYLPFNQNPQPRMTMIIESYRDPAALAGPLREMARSIDSSVPILAVRTMQEIFQKAEVMSTQLVTVLFAAASMMGLLLAMVGLHAVVAYHVSRRTREIGIRTALGAQQLQIIGMVLRQASKLSLTGIGLGFVLSLSYGRTLTMGESKGFDPVTFTLLPLALLLVTFVAAWVPARRASRVNPLQALRQD